MVRGLGSPGPNATRWKRMLLGVTTVPLDGLACSAVLSSELAGRMLRWISKKTAPILCPKDPDRCSIIVVTWQGKDLLAESLPALLQAVHLHGRDHEVIVVDNGSTDGTQEFVCTQFPEVRLIRSERNLYFGAGNNLGVKEAANDIVVLLNNDMIVYEDFLAPLLEPFKAPDVFAVGSQVFLADPRTRREETGKTRVSFNGTELDWRHEAIVPADEQKGYIPVFWGHGGAVAIDRQKFLWLGGFDRLFDPFYVEDADLSYRAWKVGWRCLLAVQSKVIHKHRSSTSRFGSRFITQIVHRNQYLFLWKNFGDLDKLWAHFRRSFRGRMRRAGVASVGIRLEAKAYLGAVKRLPSVITKRLRMARSVSRSDQAVLDRISAPGDDRIRFSYIDFAQSPFTDQLGNGWGETETEGGRSYRRMKTRASAFLRAPSSAAVLALKGFIPESLSRESCPATLTISCFGQQMELPISEGPFERRWRADLLPAGLPVEIELSVDDTAQASANQKVPVIGVESIGFVSVETPHSFSKAQQLGPQLSQRDDCRSMVRDQQVRVLMVCPYLPCRGVHGGANMMFNLIRSLSRRHRITVLSFYEDESELARAPELAQYCENLELVRRRQSFEDRNILGIRPPEIVYEFNNRRMAAHVSSYLASGAHDLIQCEYLQTAHFANLDADIPALLTNHEVLSLAYARKFHDLRWGARGKLSTLISWLRMLNYERVILKRFSGAVVLTKPEADFVAQLAPSLHVFRHGMGVDCDYFSPFLPETHEPAVVFVGNFRHFPNVSAALWLLRDIWPLIRREIPEANLYIVGGFPDVRMENYAGKNNVTMTGWVEDVRPYLAEAAVALAPVFEGAGMRTKVLEAWAMEKAVVGTRLAFEGLMEGSGEFGFVAENADEFAERTCALLRNADLARSVGQRARRLVQSEFSWDAFASFYEHIYTVTLGLKSPTRLDQSNLEGTPEGEKTVQEY